MWLDKLKKSTPQEFKKFAYRHPEVLRAIPAHELVTIILERFDLHLNISKEELAPFILKYFDWNSYRSLSIEERAAFTDKHFDPHEALATAAAAGKPEKLASFLTQHEGELALLVIDAQGQFCDPQKGAGNERTDAIAQGIQSLADTFRKAGIPIYAVYTEGQGNFYGFTPQKGDTLIAKRKDSAFTDTDLKAHLQNNGIKGLLTVGFNFSACVQRTVTSARNAGLDICLISDLTGDNNAVDCAPNTAEDVLNGMKKKGVGISSSNIVLQQLKARKHSPN